MSYDPTPGSVRIVAPSPDPLDAKVEVMQRDGSWLPLRVCSVETFLVANQINTAHIVVEPTSIDMIAMLESYEIAHIGGEVEP